MKYLIGIVLFIFMIMNSLYAQFPISAGLKIGFNSTKMPTEISNINTIKDETQSGFLAGAFVRLKLPKFYIQPEVYFTKKGGDMQYTDASNNYFTQQSSFKTVDIPLLIGVKLIDLKVVNLRIMAGPVASFITDKNITYQLNGIDMSSLLSTSPTVNFKDLIWGVQLGAGIDVLNFTLDVRYEWGVNNISDYSSMNSKSKLLHVGLGMKFF